MLAAPLLLKGAATVASLLPTIINLIPDSYKTKMKQRAEAFLAKYELVKKFKSLFGLESGPETATSTFTTSSVIPSPTVCCGMPSADFDGGVNAFNGPHLQNSEGAGFWGELP